MPPSRKRTPTQKVAENHAKKQKSSNNAQTDVSSHVPLDQLSAATKQQLIEEIVPSVTKSVVDTLVAMQLVPSTGQGVAPQPQPSTPTATPSPAGVRLSSEISLSKPSAVTDIAESHPSLSDINSFLLDNALSTSSRQTYERAYRTYKQFSEEELRCREMFPATISSLLLFIAFCFKKGFAPTTMATYISAISYYHKLHQLPDFTTSFLVKKSLQGFHNIKKQMDTRLPITLPILRKLLDSLTYTNSSHFARHLLKAMYLVAFHAFLRVGEMTSSRKEDNHTLTIPDATLVWSATNILVGFELKISQYKHSKGALKSLFIKATNCGYCPVIALKEYLDLRNTTNGPLFSFMDGSPVSRSYFSQQLKCSLTWAGLDLSKYKGHSFRIGAASTAAQKGVSEEQIKQMGRWNSDAYKKYIRIPMLHVE